MRIIFNKPIKYTLPFRYILLLWLAIICIIPFDLSRLDGTAGIAEEDMAVNRILNAILKYVHASDKSKDAAAYLAAKFLTRPDVKTVKLGGFIEQAIAMLDSADKVSMIGKFLSLVSAPI